MGFISDLWDGATDAVGDVWDGITGGGGTTQTQINQQDQTFQPITNVEVGAPVVNFNVPATQTSVTEFGASTQRFLSSQQSREIFQSNKEIQAGKDISNASLNLQAQQMDFQKATVEAEINQKGAIAEQALDTLASSVTTFKLLGGLAIAAYFLKKAKK